MQVEQVKIQEIRPYEKNAKKHPDKQINQIAKSIKEFGFNQPLVLDKDKVIVVGHGRYFAAQKLELKSVPCYIVDLSEDKKRAYRLADNKLNESSWDMELVIKELEGLDAKITGFDLDTMKLFDEVEFDGVRLDKLEKQSECPKCGYKW